MAKTTRENNQIRQNRRKFLNFPKFTKVHDCRNFNEKSSNAFCIKILTLKPLSALDLLNIQQIPWTCRVICIKAQWCSVTCRICFSPSRCSLIWFNRSIPLKPRAFISLALLNSRNPSVWLTRTLAMNKLNFILWFSILIIFFFYCRVSCDGGIIFAFLFWSRFFSSDHIEEIVITF